MSAILLSLTTFFSTLVGGLFGLRYRDHLYLIMGFTAGGLGGLASFFLFPGRFWLAYPPPPGSTGATLGPGGGVPSVSLVREAPLRFFLHARENGGPPAAP